MVCADRDHCGSRSTTLADQGTIDLHVCDTGGRAFPCTKTFPPTIQVGEFPAIHIADWPLESAIGHAQSAVASFQFKGSSAKFSGRLVPADGASR